MQIYKTTNLINDKIYIGQNQHDDENYFGSGVLILRALHKYGRENFKKEVIEECKTLEELDEKERYWINYYRNLLGKNMLYNIKSGGRIYTFSEEHRNNLSKRIFTEEHRYNIGSYRRGKPQPQRNRAIYVNDVYYESVSIAAQKLEISRLTLTSRLHNKINYSKWFYADSPKLFNECEINGKAAGPNKSNRTLLQCPHCNKSGHGNGFRQWHFDHCKFKEDSGSF